MRMWHVNKGSSFIFDCIKTLFESTEEGPYAVNRNDAPPDTVKTVADINEYLDRVLGAYRGKILFHIDEHKKMCSWNDLDVSNTGAYFSRGAMETLAQAKNVTVVTTLTEIPPLSALRSSDVCRQALIHPRIDINRFLEDIRELRFRVEITKDYQKRLYATLKFRLAVKLEEMSKIAFINRRGKREDVDKFLCDYKREAALPNIDEALTSCILLCRMSLESSPNIRNPKASIILLGESDKTEVPISSAQIPRMRIVRQNTITADLMDLLAMEDPSVTAYNDGRDIVLDAISEIIDPLDYLCSAPLVAMYFWAFATSSAIHGKLKFGTSSFIIRCQHLLPGRLFTNEKLGLYDITKLNPNVIYFADRRGQKKRSHPLADLFFVSEGDELVLIDITAGDAADVLRKSKRMAAWMR